MPRTIQFHLDESCPSGLADGLRLHGVDVTTTQDAHLGGVTDPEQLAYAHAEGRILFSRDSDFIAIHRSGADHSGIIYCHQRRRSLGEIIRRLVLAWEVYEPAEFRGRLDYI